MGVSGEQSPDSTRKQRGIKRLAERLKKAFPHLSIPAAFRWDVRFRTCYGTVSKKQLGVYDRFARQVVTANMAGIRRAEKTAGGRRSFCAELGRPAAEVPLGKRHRIHLWTEWKEQTDSAFGDLRRELQKRLILRPAIPLRTTHAMPGCPASP